MRRQAKLKHKAGGLAVAAGFAVAALLTGCGAAAPAGVVFIPTNLPEATLTVTILDLPSPTLTPEPPATLTHTPSPVPATETAAATPTVADPTAEPTAVPSATLVPSPTAGPTPDADALFRLVELPVLMYHYVEPWPPGPDELRQGLTVKPEDFAAQMAYLHANGYVTVSLYDLVDALAVGKALPEKAVVLTFDDGYRTLMDFAVPVLEQYGYTGTVFVVTQLMDEGFPQYLTWAQAETLAAKGWMIEPHTKTHDQLAGRGREFQLYQMLGSLQTVEAHIGRAPRFFAYPSGQYDDLSVQIAKELHLWGAVTVNYGREHNLNELHTLGRVRVSGTGTLEEFVAALLGGLP
jgi:peptidoglycan/xylan/chitin deacetylase (PgdA/CDA1 family)